MRCVEQVGRMGRFVLGLSLFLGCSYSFAEIKAPSPSAERVELVKEALQLRDCSIVEIGPAQLVNRQWNVQLAFENETMELRLAPHSDRAPTFRVLAQGENGQLVEINTVPVRTVRGSVAGVEGSIVAGAMLDDGFHAVIRIPNQRSLWIEPVPAHIRANQHEHVVYRAEDLLPSGKRCSMPDQIEAMNLPHDDHGQQGVGRGAGGGPCVALLACDADFEFFQEYGSVQAVVDRITLIMNAVNVQYESEVNITHQIGTIVVRANENDPYTASASSDLVCEFITHWLANHNDIDRDVAQLFTGRTIDGNTIGQAADIGDICNKHQGCCNCGLYGSDGSFCYVWSNFQGAGSTAFANCTDLSAHELGHLWGGQHCPCVAPAYTMNPFITGANVHSPVFSIPLITMYRDTRPCLEPCRGGNANDDCINAIAISNDVIAFDTNGATTDGLAHPGLCQYDGQTFNDVWFTYTPTCSTDHIISLCGSGYDTDVVVYAGIECPATTARVVACNDDGCTDPQSLHSITTAFLHKDQPYLIRIGGWQSPDYGIGSLAIIANPTVDTDSDGVLNCDDNCPEIANANQADCDQDGIGDACAAEADCNKNSIPDSCDITAGTSIDANGNGIPDECEPATCSGDANGDGLVNVTDLLAVIAAWGPCPAPCNADFNIDGIVNVSDLLTVIGAWGPCP